LISLAIGVALVDARGFAALAPADPAVVVVDTDGAVVRVEGIAHSFVMSFLTPDRT